MKMKGKNLFIMFLIMTAIALSACTQTNPVENIDDVSILETEDSIDDIAADIGIEETDSKLVDLGNLDESNVESIEDAADIIGIEVDDSLIEFGELI
jgi:hypothetical protein